MEQENKLLYPLHRKVIGKNLPYSQIILIIYFNLGKKNSNTVIKLNTIPELIILENRRFSGSRFDSIHWAIFNSYFLIENGKFTVLRYCLHHQSSIQF